jgi:hypothetical protein
MTLAAHLIPLLCPKCQNALPAAPNELAWACPTCGQGLVFSPERGLDALEIHYLAGLPPGKNGIPYWVATGAVLLDRKSYSGNKSNEMQAFWNQPKRFFVPAIEMSLEALASVGMRLLKQPPKLESGPAAPFQPATVGTEDVRALAEFVVFAIEADRADKLKTLKMELTLTEPELWVLPVV